MKLCAMYKSGSTILNSLKFINVNSRKAVKYTVTEAKFTAILRISLDVMLSGEGMQRLKTVKKNNRSN